MNFPVKFVILTTVFILSFLSLVMQSDGLAIEKVYEPEIDAVKNWSSDSDELHEPRDSRSKMFHPRNIPHRWRRDEGKMTETQVQVNEIEVDYLWGRQTSKRPSLASSTRFKRFKRDSETEKVTPLKKMNETDLNLLEFALSNVFFVP